jgi:hypothetical protein
MNKNQFLKNILIGASAAVIFVVIITIAGELYKIDGKQVIKEVLKAWHGHHWVGKGIWAAGIFLIASGISAVFNRRKIEEHLSAFSVSMLTFSLVLGTIILYGFFTFEYIIH